MLPARVQAGPVSGGSLRRPQSSGFAALRLEHTEFRTHTLRAC
jgi:hypothetical protein